MRLRLLLLTLLMGCAGARPDSVASAGPDASASAQPKAPPAADPTAQASAEPAAQASAQPTEAPEDPPPPPTVSARTKELLEQLRSKDWGEVFKAKSALEAQEREAIQGLIEMLSEDRKVPLKNTADLIYPGAAKFYGHGYLLDYDIDWLSARAGWVLEEITFENFGFREGSLRKPELLAEVMAGKHDLPMDKVVALEKDPAIRRRLREAAVKAARTWWAARKGRFRRIDALVDALKSPDQARQGDALGYLRSGETPCAGLTQKSFEERILPEIKRLAKEGQGGYQGVQRQAQLALPPPPPERKELTIHGVRPGVTKPQILQRFGEPAERTTMTPSNGVSFVYTMNGRAQALMAVFGTTESAYVLDGDAVEDAQGRTLLKVGASRDDVHRVFGAIPPDPSGYIPNTDRYDFTPNVLMATYQKDQVVYFTLQIRDERATPLWQKPPRR